MGRRHWLDPLARQLLQASGQLPETKPATRATRPAAKPEARAKAEVEARAAARRRLAEDLGRDPARSLRDGNEVALAAELGWRLDVNRATAADWRRLPGCTADHVDLLLRLQAGGVQLSGPDDLRALLGVSEALVRSWEPLLSFRWYDGAPTPAGPAAIAVNQAGGRQLETLPGLTPERLRRLLRERARAPFRDLADLQLRLRFPPTVVEQWIGRVSFRPGPAGPLLPPGAGPRR